MAIESLVALRGHAFFLGISPLYKSCLAKHVEPHPVLCKGRAAKAERDRRFRRLRNLDALCALALVWKESAFVTEEMLASVGLTRRFADGVTRHALANAIARSDDCPTDGIPPPKYRLRTSRLVDAAMTFDLIELERRADSGKGNAKPLRATARLNKLMITIGIEIAMLAGAAFQNGDGSSPSGKPGAGGSR